MTLIDILNTEKLETVTMISPDDEMMMGDTHFHYFSVSRSALNCIIFALLIAGKNKEDIRSVLDLPCGHGRVLRSLRAAFPDATITACDINRSGVDFCSSTFGAKPVYSSRIVKEISFNERFDLIWCGSLFTHISSLLIQDFLEMFISILAPNGVLVFSMHGSSCIYAARQRIVTYSLDEDSLNKLFIDFEQDGFSYHNYHGCSDYGVSFASRPWTVKIIEKFPDLRLLTYTEMGWDNHHDVISCVNESFNARIARALSK